MNIILYIGPHGRAPFGLVLIFLAIWVISYFYGTWKRSQNIALNYGNDKKDSNYWNQRIFLLIVGLIALLLPLIRGLIGQNTIRSGGFEKSFEAFSSEAVRNLILFFLPPYLISAGIMFIKKQFPTRVFNNLVIIMVVLAMYMSFQSS